MFPSLDFFQSKDLYVPGYGVKDYVNLIFEGGVEFGGSAKICKKDSGWKIVGGEVYAGVFFTGTLGVGSQTSPPRPRNVRYGFIYRSETPDPKPGKGFWANVKIEGKVTWILPGWKLDSNTSGIFLSSSAGWRYGRWVVQWNSPMKRLYP